MGQSDAVKLLEMVLGWRYPKGGSRGFRYHVNAEHPWCESGCVMVFLSTVEAPYCMADFTVGIRWLCDSLEGQGFRGFFDMVESIYSKTDEAESRLSALAAEWHENNKAN